MANFAWKIDFYFKLPEKIKIFKKFAWKNRNLLKICLEKSKFCKICLEKSKFFENLPGKFDFLCKIAWKSRNFSKISLKNRNFWPGSMTLQISNQIDAAAPTGALPLDPAGGLLVLIRLLYVHPLNQFLNMPLPSSACLLQAVCQDLGPYQSVAHVPAYLQWNGA